MIRLKNKVCWVLIGIFLLQPACTDTANDTENPPLTPSTPISTPGHSEGVKPPSTLNLAPVPPEAFEMRRILANAVYPLRDPIEVAHRLTKPSQPIPKVARETPWSFRYGDAYTFWVRDQISAQPRQANAQLHYLTAHTYLFIEEGVHVRLSEIIDVIDQFEESVYPANRAFFGSEWVPGVDNDPHIFILMAKDSGLYQNSNDEFSHLVFPYSNEKEIIYIDAATDPEDLPCLLAHEFQHLSQWAVDPNEETWLFEGFSELACPLNGMRAWYQDDIVTGFANQPGIQVNSWNSSETNIYAQYGASFLFVNYFYERFGERATRALIANPANGIDSVDSVLSGLQLGSNFNELFLDWVIANKLDDTKIVDGRFGYHQLDIPTVTNEADIRISDLPIDRTVKTAQFSADYFMFNGPGNYQIDFAGATIVGLAPITAYSGKHVWWSGRGTNSATNLTRAFDLGGLVNVTLTFQTWFDIEKDYDHAYVEISRDFKNWEILQGAFTTLDDPFGVNFGHGYTGGIGSEWATEKIDLSEYSGEQIWLRFEYLTDDGPISPGFFIDDITIHEIGFRDNVESVESGWVAQGFVRSALVLPQEWALQWIVQEKDATTIERAALSPDNRGSWEINLDEGETATLVITAITRWTTQAGEYWIAVSPSGE